MNLDRLKNLAHTFTASEAVIEAESAPEGLSPNEVRSRLDKIGPNEIPSARADTLVGIILRQFKDPLIYVLFIVGVISFFLGHVTDGLFIMGVLAFNAVIGAFQEYGAEKSAMALREMSRARCRVLRANQKLDIDSCELVPGDVVLLESGNKVPADLRLLESKELRMDESLLTGESFSVEKFSELKEEKDTVISDRRNMVYAGTYVSMGRGKGLVSATGINTVLGSIALSVAKGGAVKTPLILRMERFSKNLTLILAGAVTMIGAILVLKGESITSVLMMAVALGVAAIPEGLPVALTVALSIASRRMAKKNVIVRRLAAVEALGSCTYIGTDKTGTLTVNKLSIEKALLPSGAVPIGEESASSKELKRFLLAGILCNEAEVVKLDDGKPPSFEGDPVDVSFLRAALESGFDPRTVRQRWTKEEEVAFESERQYSAGIYKEHSGRRLVCVKGAVEKVSSMCEEARGWEKTASDLAGRGYRVLAVAGGDGSFHADLKNLKGLEFYGLAAMIDPPRPETKACLERSSQAGLEVSMITGDHPMTAKAIAMQTGIAHEMDRVVTGKELRAVQSKEELDLLTEGVKVFARVEPSQKLDIVESAKRRGEFVALTGDGANDAPALKAAHVGIAMGKSGTDVAKETADLIITDDKFSSIIAGIEEGRVAYGNIRKVVYLLISTGLGEIVLFVLALASGLPMPLGAVQLLWLNLVTNGIQDIALAFEPREGNELSRPPRRPEESVFNRLMIQRVALSSSTMGMVAFIEFWSLLDSGMELAEAQNRILLLMVFFENIMIGNARSETRSGLLINPLRNKFLLVGAIGAQALHLWAMNWPVLGSVLGAAPVSVGDWFYYLGLSVSVFVVVEIHKYLNNRRCAKS